MRPLYQIGSLERYGGISSIWSSKHFGNMQTFSSHHAKRIWCLTWTTTSLKSSASEIILRDCFVKASQLTTECNQYCSRSRLEKTKRYWKINDELSSQERDKKHLIKKQIILHHTSNGYKYWTRICLQNDLLHTIV